jgi:hypothetical protein
MALFQDKPQFRFLLRACAYLILMLLVWWIFLLDPLLGWMRVSGDWTLSMIPGATDGNHVTVLADGNWMVQLPVPAAAANRPDLQQAAGAKKVRSFKMQTSRTQVALFTLAMPLFLALMLTVRPPWKEIWRPVAYGGGAILLMMPVVLALHGMATIREYFHIAGSPLVEFFWASAGYLNSEVFPYLVPLFLAVGLNKQLRAQVFALVPMGPPEPASTDAPMSKKERKRQRRREARA